MTERLRPSAPVAEHHRDALGIGEVRPRLSWVVPAGLAQEAYELEVDTVAGGRIDSTDSVLVDWPAAPLRSRERTTVRVRVWGPDAVPSDWSDPAAIEAGLLDPADWSAVAIGPAETEPADPADRRPALLRREFTLPGPIRSARLYSTAHGVYEAELNGQRIGDEVLAPGITDYRSHLVVATHDVTKLLQEGANVIGVRLADGWFRGRYGSGYDNYGTRTAFLGQLEVELADGSRVTVPTDEHWRSSVGGILTSSLYDGETFDAREEGAGAWDPVEERVIDLATLRAPDGPPIRRTQELAPVSVERAPSGELIVDFGQNLVGWLRLRVTGAAGDTVTIRHAEVLEDGELAVRPLRTARATDRYTLAGGGAEVWEPRFTIHGFRYAGIRGWPGEFDPNDVVAVVCNTDMERTGWLTTSDASLNRLHENIVWSLRGNFVGIPTDCPQRDERYGWTGDLQLFAPTAAYLYDVSGMLRSWLRDLAAEQSPDGVVPWMVPAFGRTAEVTPLIFQPAAVWGDAAVLAPWELYRQFGDLAIVEAQYESAKAWVRMVERRSEPDHVWDGGHQFGDWLDPTAPPDAPDKGATDPVLVATAYHARSAEVLSWMAVATHRDEDAVEFGELAAAVRAAFLNRFCDAEGRLASDSQTAYALAIAFDLYRGDPRAAFGERRLVELVEERGHRIATGLAGTALILDALEKAGRLDAAYRMLLERGCPSWLYPVDMGATTVWERWDSLLPDGSVNPGEMTSFNHYALGSVGDWMHRVVGGLASAEPGYRTILFRPRPGGGITSARTEHVTPYGRARIDWVHVDDELRLTVEVPSGTSAIVDLPGRDQVLVGPGTHTFEERLIGV